MQVAAFETVKLKWRAPPTAGEDRNMTATPQIVTGVKDGARSGAGKNLVDQAAARAATAGITATG